jgi:predicted  nucleic acid-binding Zn-ribbon protein
MSPRRWLGLASLGLIAANAVVPSQAQSAAPSTMEALLAEVRGLRAEVNQVAGTSIRTQLLVARLQLQEQRIAGISKQLTDVQTQRIAVEGATTQTQERLKRLDEMDRDPATTPEQRRQLPDELIGTRRAVNDMRQRLQRLTEQESFLSGQLLSEQSRWTDFNDRLDQIEREIAASRAR